MTNEMADRSSSVFFVSLLLVVGVSLADVSHFFPSDFGYFQQHPFHIVQPPQHSLPSLYSAPSPFPPPQQPPIGGYPNPVFPPPSQTPSPVAPVSTTTEFILPEIVENRNAKDHGSFIPLHNHYLPPEERPNYDGPKPLQPGYGYLPPKFVIQQKPQQTQLQFFAYSNGYYYPRPPSSTAISTTTTTTTQRPPLMPDPIVVLDPPELLPPMANPPAHQGPQGYDYNAPPPPPAVIVPLRPPSTPAPAYLPPDSNVAAGEDGAVVEHLDPSLPPLRLHVQEMRCMQNQGGYFRSVLKVNSFIGAAPSVDNDSYDKRCELKLSRSYVVVDIASEDFHKCGVHACGKDLCLRLRFPAIRGMRTGADAILTLHCRTQERVAVKTHALKMGVSNDVQARSIGTYARGGTQNAFRTQIELLRRSGNGFTRHLETNGAVQLGEELLLRAHVLPGDGWNYTKLTDVGLQRISASGELLNDANLITARGCINPSMQSICTQQPSFDPPLGHRLHFKAVMFQGMRSGEELVMSMRITGCLEQHDCQVHGQECSANNLGRRRRDTRHWTTNNLAAADKDYPIPRNGTEMSEISRISFRVIMPEEQPVVEQTSGEQVSGEEVHHENVPNLLLHPDSVLLTGTLGFVGLLTCLGIFVLLKLRN